MREFDTGATRDDSVDKLDFEGFLSPLALERYAAYMHAHRKQADGKMRNSDNWQKGLPIRECVKSMFRHFVDLWRLNRGYSAEDIKDGHFISVEETCCAIIFNAFSIIHVRQHARQHPQPPILDPASGTSTPREDPDKFEKMVNESCFPPCPPPETMIFSDKRLGTCAPSFPPTQYGGNE